MLLTFLPGKLFIWSLGVFSALFFVLLSETNSPVSHFASISVSVGSGE